MFEKELYRRVSQRTAESHKDKVATKIRDTKIIPVYEFHLAGEFIQLCKL